MGDTAIPYATKTWNPVHGCTPVAEGCRNCWAKRVAETRLRGRGTYPTDEPFRVTLDPSKLDEPLHWEKPQRVMTCSMGDPFHEEVPDDFIHDIWDVMRRCRRHTFLLFTKRPERLLSWYNWAAGAGPEDPDWMWRDNHLPNVWIIASASTQAEVDRIVPVLLQIPAAKRGLSLEPLVEPVQLRDILVETEEHGAVCIDALGGEWAPEFPPPVTETIDWVIVGCESGPHRRPMELDWARSLRDQCVMAQVPFYFKQAELDGRVVEHPYLDGRRWMEIPGQDGR